ncbi:uncharacterized protein LOC131220956 [Magnolia sinica]|uniref:uncharacterized protein LOC131220956 n=1 Tax=Magnolia sinica TaxID=86752 RepID=UPI00265994CA|nr:uncharacterized protein LOC131220956 [Magnolia sinica]
MRISPLKKEAKQSSSPPASTQRLDAESKHGETDSSTHGQRTVATLEQQIKEYEKRMKELEYEVIILQLKVRELEANDKSHLACKVEAHSLRKDKEAAEALATAYKEQLNSTNRLISRTISKGSTQKRRESSDGDESLNKRQKTGVEGDQ